MACKPTVQKAQVESPPAEKLVKERTHDTIYDSFGDIIVIQARESARVKKTTPKPSEGMIAFLSQVQENLAYPEAARENGIEGTVGIIVEVLPDSTIAIFTVDGMGYGTEEAASQAVLETKMKWIPSINEKTGEAISARSLIPVEFKLRE
jgi:hypothetical protein